MKSVHWYRGNWECWFERLSLWRRSIAQNVSFRNSLRWPIYIINSVVKTRLSYYTLPTQHQSFFLWTYPVYSFIKKKVFSVSGRFWPRQLLLEKCLIHLLASSCRWTNSRFVFERCDGSSSVMNFFEFKENFFQNLICVSSDFQFLFARLKCFFKKMFPITMTHTYSINVPLLHPLLSPSGEVRGGST